MIGEGVLGPRALEAALAQRFPPLDASMLRASRALARRPALARKMAMLGARVARLAILYAAHPRDPRRQAAWADRVHRAMA
jgi:hypothetical protein